MQTYFANQSLSLSIPLINSANSAVTDASNVVFSVQDASGAEIVPSTPVTVTAGTGLADINLDATAHQLADGEVRAYRKITITFDSGATSHSVFEEYLIEALDALIVMTNSFQTYPEAILKAAGLTQMEPFNAATRRDQITALTNAYSVLANLKYHAPRKGGMYGLGYNGYDYGYGFSYSFSPAAPEWEPKDELINIPGMTVETFNALHKGLTNALKLTQIIEANEALNQFSILRKRQQGLMSETIGESSMMFRPEKVLNLPMTRRSLNYLRPYLRWDLGVGRG